MVPFVVEEILKQKDISRVTHEFWLGMDSDRQKIFFNEFIKLRHRANTVESSDSLLEMHTSSLLLKTRTSQACTKY